MQLPWGGAPPREGFDPDGQGAEGFRGGGVWELRSSPLLRGCVRCYHYTEAHLGQMRVSKPLTARPEQMLQFSLRRPFIVVDHDSGTGSDAPDVVLVGRQTRRNIDLVATGDVTTFTVHFEPTGFYRLFHIPLTHVTNLTPDAEDVLGSEVRVLHERLQHSATPFEMAAHVDAMLAFRLQNARPPHPVQTAAAAFLAPGCVINVRALAAERNLSVRQFERAFLSQVGVPPKLFGQVARFARALEAKSRDPHSTWGEIAVDAGYYDQMHLVRECHRFGGAAPSTLIRSWINCTPDGVLDRRVASVLAP